MRKFLNFSGTSCAPFISLFTNNTFFKIPKLSTKGKVFVLPLVFLLLSLSAVLAQDGIERLGIPSNVKGLLAEGLCPADPCPCEGGFVEMKVYYFGEDNVTIDVYADNGLSILITSLAGVNSGDLLIIDGSSMPLGKLNPKTYFKVTNAMAEVCVTRIFSKCPTNSWPGALEDLNPLGKTFGDFIVFAHTDQGNNNECTIADANQDWHVGGNVIEASKNTMGTRNNEDVVFISDDTPRGVITKTGDFGINTNTPAARLDVQGDVIIEETLDVNGIARMNAGDASLNPTSGALIVTGGAGISENLNVGNDARINNDLFVGNNADVGNNLNVVADATIGQNLDVGVNTTTGNNLSVGNNAQVNNDLFVDNNTQVGNNLSVTVDAVIGQNLTVGVNAAISNDMAVGGVIFGNTIVSNGSNLTIRSTNSNDIIINAEAADGKVAIGTTNIPNNVMGTDVSAYKLFVSGGILTEEVRVRTDWADYVFENDYLLRPLGEVKNHIVNFGHLPGIPTAKEVETQGLELGSNAKNQQIKIEEIFLYLIQLDEKVSALEAENTKLKALLQK